MSHEVIMPVLGMNQNHGVIAKWHKQEGDKVSIGDVLMDVETDKAIMEIEAKKNGYLKNVSYEAGIEIPVGETVAIIVEKLAHIEKQQLGKETKSLSVVEKKNKSDKKMEDILPMENKEVITKKKQIASHNILASPKAKMLAQQYAISLDDVARKTTLKVLHADNINDYYFREKKRVNAEGGFVLNKITTIIEMSIKKSEFQSCLKYLLEKTNENSKNGGHLIALLTWNLIKKHPLVLDRLLKGSVKVTGWDGRKLATSYVDTSNLDQFSSLTVHQKKNHDCVFEVLCFQGCHINSVNISTVSLPTIILQEESAYLHIKLLGFEAGELTKTLAFGEELAQCIEHPLLHLI